ncbi:hypothetical protein [Staphylococcus haemolyticus]|uniref:hypothetical protein n=1 Tax=Staphylococcus haemolyticus TaxID=1283 RepID=UPI001375631A|nr:hypothetical protein [Staphylococcus haemolyticus]
MKKQIESFQLTKLGEDVPAESKKALSHQLLIKKARLKSKNKSNKWYFISYLPIKHLVC